MCGRFSEKTDLKKLAKELKIPLDSFPKRKPRYNIAPTQPVLAMTFDERKKIDILHWGLIPSWAKDPAIGSRMINARAETLTSKPSFRGLIKSRRCLVLADGFYEWKKEGSGKQPFYIRLKNKQPFTFAGLWSYWSSATGSEIRSCTIITTEPNELVRPIHDRMPVILPHAARDPWLDPKNHDPKDVLPFLKPYPEEAMEAYPVGTHVNSPRNDSPDCIRKGTVKQEN